jgi:hypothetical protein
MSELAEILFAVMWRGKSCHRSDHLLVRWLPRFLYFVDYRPMSLENSASVRITRFEEGDALVTQRIWERYSARFIANARQRLRASP